MVFFIDLDGTVFPYDTKLWCSESLRPIPGCVEQINRLYDAGHEIIFSTSRMAEYEAVTRKQLDAAGFRYHRLLMQLAHGPRIVVNDTDPGQPDRPLAVGVPVARNAGFRWHP